jgi:hypothetical protein
MEMEALKILLCMSGTSSLKMAKIHQQQHQRMMKMAKVMT